MYWYTYLAQCKDGSLYTGITTNIQRREVEHNTDSKLGAKSLRGKRPVHIFYYERYSSQTEARRREVEIKAWKRKYKIKLISKNKRFFRVYTGNFIPANIYGFTRKITK